MCQNFRHRKTSTSIRAATRSIWNSPTYTLDYEEQLMHQSRCLSKRTKSSVAQPPICRKRACHQKAVSAREGVFRRRDPVAVSCRALNLARQPYCRWLAAPYPRRRCRCRCRRSLPAQRFVRRSPESVRYAQAHRHRAPCLVESQYQQSAQTSRLRSGRGAQPRRHPWFGRQGAAWSSDDSYRVDRVCAQSCRREQSLLFRHAPPRQQAHRCRRGPDSEQLGTGCLR